ncbi:uncharacterized protein [Venturia canescens]|uniref:uncharacterized protein n=1 Tax=Venturia canescens TaxID=32260 RepID=UPI001C9CAE70|nr:uncharacterized protein LOC122419110 [Venturia canescens]
METNIKIEKDERRNSIEKILMPSTFVCWLLGVGVPRPLKYSKMSTIILRFVHFAMCSVIVAYGAIDFFTFGAVFKSDTFKIMYYSNKVACYISSYYYVFHGLHHYEKWPELMEKLSIIDKKLKRFFPANFNRNIKLFQLFSLFATIMIGPVSMISHGVYYYFIRPEDIFASDLLLYYTMAQSLIVNFSFDLTVIAIYDRFRAINQAIGKIDETYTAALIVHELRRARELYHDCQIFVFSGVCQIVRFLNGIYGIHLLLSSVNSFTMVVATLFRIYMGVVEKKYSFMLINNVIWITHAAQFAITCGVCSRAGKESSKTIVCVHEIVLSRVPKARSPCDLYAVDVARISLDSEISLRHEINDFSSQLQSRDVFFTASDFFDMDNALLRSFIGVITTYLIILVQFYQPETDQEETFTTLGPEAIEI